MFRHDRRIARRAARHAARIAAADPLDARQIQTLAQANRLLQSGQFAQAAPLFAQVAREMEASFHPRRAANLHAQAAHAFADSNNQQAALEHSRAALTLFIQNQMVDRIPMFYENITRKMLAHNMKSAVDVLQHEFGAQVGSIPVQPVAPAMPVSQARSLPTNCPQCGAPVRNRAVTGDVGECEYCGSLLQAE